MEDLLKTVTIDLGHFAEACGALVIAYATMRALVVFVIGAVRTPGGIVPAESIRLNLGRALALSLEFLLGADIPNTAIAPTWSDVELLAAIAAIRTALNYFLGRELAEEAENREAGVSRVALSEPGASLTPRPPRQVSALERGRAAPGETSRPRSE